MIYKIFTAVIMLMAFTINAQTYSKGVSSIVAKYQGKYTLTVTHDEAKNTLSYKTTAPITSLIFSTYTAAQLSIRKGDDVQLGLEGSMKTFTFNLNEPEYKNKYAYWLKLYVGPEEFFAEYFIRKKTTTPDETLEAETAFLKSREPKTILSNITCKEGEKKVIAALQNLGNVFDIKVNKATGNISYRNYKMVTFEQIATILKDNGFMANGIHSTNPSANPCVKNYSNRSSSDYKEVKNALGITTIKTNITCALGKTKVTKALIDMDGGVTDINIDIKTGKLTLKYSTDGTTYKAIIEQINEQGFHADGHKTTKKFNACVQK